MLGTYVITFSQKTTEYLQLILVCERLIHNRKCLTIQIRNILVHYILVTLVVDFLSQPAQRTHNYAMQPEYSAKNILVLNIEYSPFHIKGNKK